METNHQIFRFKTNINCSGCVATVKPHLDNVQGIGNWEVDITDKDKVLTVTTNSISPQQVRSAVQQAGYKIELAGEN